jgi:hypothetical protein
MQRVGLTQAWLPANERRAATRRDSGRVGGFCRAAARQARAPAGGSVEARGVSNVSGSSNTRHLCGEEPRCAGNLGANSLMTAPSAVAEHARVLPSVRIAREAPSTRAVFSQAKEMGAGRGSRLEPGSGKTKVADPSVPRPDRHLRHRRGLRGRCSVANPQDRCGAST